MAETITCPNCSYEFELSEALSAQLEERLTKQFEAKTHKKELDAPNQWTLISETDFAFRILRAFLRTRG